MGQRRLRGSDDVDALAERLNGAEREWPIALVSTSAATGKPWIDVDVLADEFGDLVEVLVIETGDDTWNLTGRLPDGTQVYGGAGRVYPVGHAWVDDLRRSPLRFAHDPASGDRATRLLVADGLGMAAEAGLLGSVETDARSRVAGLVTGLMAGRAFVRLDNGETATIAHELTLPDVPLDRLLTKGQRVEGSLDRASRRLDVRAALRTGETLPYAVGDVVLAVVKHVAGAVATLRLFPGTDVAVPRNLVTGNPLDDLRGLLTLEEVVIARVIEGPPRWTLSLLDVDDDEEPKSAPSVMAGGPPWLLPPADEPPATPVALDDVPAELPTVAEPSSPASALPPAAPPDASPPRPSPYVLDPQRRTGPPPPPPVPKPEPHAPQPAAAPSALAKQQALTIDTLKGEQRSLQDQLTALRAEREALSDQLTAANKRLDRLASENKQLRTRARKASARAERSGSAAFLDPEEQLRFDVSVAWAHRIPAADKARHPLPQYAVSPGFVDSVEALEGVSRDKVLDVVVEVLTGLAQDLPGRELHRLRTSEAGDAPQRKRAGGATAWRVSLQSKSPSARRLHYWRLPDGSVELARVAVHDDFSI